MARLRQPSNVARLAGMSDLQFISKSHEGPPQFGESREKG